MADGHSASLAQSVERKTLNLVVVGSSPTGGAKKLLIFAQLEVEEGVGEGLGKLWRGWAPTAAADLDLDQQRSRRLAPRRRC